MSGVGPVTSARFVAALDDVGRFPAKSSDTRRYRRVIAFNAMRLATDPFLRHHDRQYRLGQPVEVPTANRTGLAHCAAVIGGVGVPPNSLPLQMYSNQATWSPIG